MQAFLFCVCVCVCETMENGDKNHENTLIKDQDLQKPYPYRAAHTNLALKWKYSPRLYMQYLQE